ncbi:hypothetical protein [Geodermatophilus chilensis]|uniref:hypothetical protein n=1 Tax=Geodermatophilus chilensis TaxID=2035835 RepID=UPI000C264F6C|nr:hypothetical protein [Geodermatophilus chilensis]
MTVFVTMYHPELGNRRAQVSKQAVNDYAIYGWLLVDGSTPAPTDQYLTPAAGDLRYLRSTDVTETVQDVVGAALVAGAGVQVTVDDIGDTITIASTAVLPTRQVLAGTGLTGGGDLSADRTLAVSYGTAAGSAVQGNDARVTADQAAGTASIRTLGTGAQQAAAGNHGHTATAITDSTTVGRSVLTAADAPAARTAIGAGTSNLAIGTTSTTAAAGNDIRIVGAAQRRLTQKAVTGSYTLVAGDATDTVLHTTASSALTITLPADSAVSIATEIALPWRQYGGGQITFAAGSGATVLSRGSAFKSAGQYAEGVVTKVATNTWLLSGDVVA